jgi:hypothetical protein
MSKPSNKNTRTFYLEDAVDAAINQAATREHGGNRSAYIKRLVLRDLKNRITAATNQQGQECPNNN